MNEQQWEKHARLAQQKEGDRGDQLVLLACAVIALMLVVGAAFGLLAPEVPL